MAINVQPNFIPGYLNPQDLPKAPQVQADQTPGLLGGIAHKSAEVLDSFLKRELARRKSESDIAESSSMSKFRDLQGQKIQQDLDTEKERKEYYKTGKLPGETEAPATPPVAETPEAPAPGTSGTMMGKDLPKESPQEAPVAPKEELKKFDAEVEVEASKEYQEQVKDLLAAHYFNPNSDKAGLNAAKKKLKAELASELIQKQLSDQLTPDMTYEQAKARYRDLDPKGFMKSSDVEGVLKNYPTQAQKAKDDRDANHQQKTEDLAQKNYDLSKNTNDMNARKEIQAQTKDMGDKIADNQYNRVTSAISRINQDLDSGKVKLNETSMVALKGLMARTDNVTLTTAIINKVLGINPVDDATKQALQDFENDKKAQKLMKDAKFTGFYANLADLVAASLKKESGAAVTPSELQTFLGKLGLSSWGGSAETFLAGLEKYSTDLDNELKGFNAKYDPEAIKAFQARGGAIPTVIFRKGRAAPAVSSPVAKTGDAPKKRLVFDPATGDFK